MMDDTISRQAAIDVMLMAIDDDWEPDYATDRMNELPSAQPSFSRDHENDRSAEPCEDAVSRADMLNELDGWIEGFDANCHKESFADMKLVRSSMSKLPSAQHTLYGYKLEHLAYIARVMEKEGVTAEYAVRTFDDISRAVRMIIDEAQEKVEDMLNEQFNRQTGGD